jgi:hypothetical protein
VEDAEGHSTEELAQALYDQTGGHPFYLVEVLRSLVERGALVAHEDSHDRKGDAPHLELLRGLDALPRLVPETVREQVVDRLAGLDPEAFQLLVAAVVLGTNASYERLCEAAGVDERVGLAALDELCQRGLLTEDGVSPESGEADLAPAVYRFQYDLVRDVVIAAAGETRRRVLQGRALTVMERERELPLRLSVVDLADVEEDEDVSCGTGCRLDSPSVPAHDMLDRLPVLVTDILQAKCPLLRDLTRGEANLTQTQADLRVRFASVDRYGTTSRSPLKESCREMVRRQRVWAHRPVLRCVGLPSGDSASGYWR